MRELRARSSSLTPGENRDLGTVVLQQEQP
jgi:hypothetical protein